LCAALRFGAAFFPRNFAFALIFFAPRFGFFCFAFFAMSVSSAAGQSSTARQRRSFKTQPGLFAAF
jgi:hypothetical protein